MITTLVLLLSRSRTREYKRVRGHDYIHKLDEVRERTYQYAGDGAEQLAVIPNNVRNHVPIHDGGLAYIGLSDSGPGDKPEHLHLGGHALADLLDRLAIHAHPYDHRHTQVFVLDALNLPARAAIHEE
jgi:hypothetical protein